MNVEIRTDAAQFLFGEYKNRLFLCSVASNDKDEGLAGLVGGGLEVLVGGVLVTVHLHGRDHFLFWASVGLHL